MNSDHVFFGVSLPLVQRLGEIVAQGEEGPYFSDRIPDVHPVDRSSLISQWRKWLKECRLRKQELPTIEFAQWLRQQRESTITGMVEAMEHSPAHLFYEEILPIIRVELQQAENQKPDHADAETLKPKVLDLVKKGQLKAAVELVSEFVNEQQEWAHHRDDLVHIQSELAHQNESERKGLLPLEYSRRARNQLLHALLGIMDDLQLPETS